MKKQAINKKSKTCKVTFELPAEVNAQTACLVAVFNDWNIESHPMTRGEDGSFSLTVALKPRSGLPLSLSARRRALGERLDGRCL